MTQTRSTSHIIKGLEAFLAISPDMTIKTAILFFRIIQEPGLPSSAYEDAGIEKVRPMTVNRLKALAATARKESTTEYDKSRALISTRKEGRELICSLTPLGRQVAREYFGITVP